MLLTTGAAGTLGFAYFAWPFLDSMNPATDVLVQSTIDASLSYIKPGQAITVVWRGRPVFVHYRTPQEIQAADEVPLPDLIGPETEQKRVKKGHEEWLIVVGVCTHLECLPLGQRSTENRGKYGGWFARVMGPFMMPLDERGTVLPLRLHIPPYKFLAQNLICIGENESTPNPTVKGI